jgi:hypothetical protein
VKLTLTYRSSSGSGFLRCRRLLATSATLRRRRSFLIGDLRRDAATRGAHGISTAARRSRGTAGGRRCTAGRCRGAAGRRWRAGHRWRRRRAADRRSRSTARGERQRFAHRRRSTAASCAPVVEAVKQPGLRINRRAEHERGRQRQQCKSSHGVQSSIQKYRRESSPISDSDPHIAFGSLGKQVDLCRFFRFWRIRGSAASNPPIRVVVPP